MSNIDLIKQYVDTGVAISEHQFNKLNNNLKKTYIRKREIAVTQGSDLYRYEFSFLSEKALVGGIEHGAKVVIKYNSLFNPFEQRSSIFTYIENPTEEMKIAVVKHNPSDISLFDNPSEEMQLAAVQGDGDVIYYISNPSEKVQFAAINQNPFSYYKIKRPTENVEKWAKESDIRSRYYSGSRFNESINRIKTLLTS